MNKNHYFGTSILVGKPNVGKSTIINKLVNTKISIVSKKPHTTQNHITGIQNIDLNQSVYIDTPGILNKFVYTKQNEIFKKTKSLIHNVQLILFVLEKNNWTQEDEYVLNIIKNYNKPIIAIINKIDKIKNIKILLPYIFILNKKYLFQEIIPISGKTGKNIDTLSKIIQSNLPISQHRFPKYLVTTSDVKKAISETIREKFILYLGNELPHSIHVTIKQILFKKSTEKSYINAEIIVNNNQHKKIVIGKKGNKIKLCGILARKELEYMLKKSIYLSLTVTKSK